MNEYFLIGKFASAHGLNGELVLWHELGKKTSLKGLKVIFTEENGKFLPWFLESAKIKNEQEVYIKLESVSTREAAMKLVKKKAWLLDVDHKKFSAKSSPANLLGYEIINGTEELGKILEVIPQAQQLICRLEIKGKEVLIPLHDASLRKIDHRKKQVILDLPDGLLDIYLT